MYQHFMKIKSLEGELKLSHKKHDFGLTVSTKELVLQKPHVNYHIKLEDIVSIVPYCTSIAPTFTLTDKGVRLNETRNGASGVQLYKFHAHKATLHNRSGIFPMGPTAFIIPVVTDMLLAISKYGELESILTD